MTIDLESLCAEPNALASHYSRFRVSERLLLTGHSHQAWPDRAERGLLAAYADAAELIDGKWRRAFEKADLVRAGFRRLLDDPHGRYSLAASTHDLLVRLLSALDLKARPRLVTTDGEFHSLRRQLARLEEEGIEICRVASSPAESVGERLANAVDDHTAAVLVSTVFYDSGQIAGGLEAAAEGCRRHGAIFVLDTYHQLGVVPFSLTALGFEDAYAVGGGYKYLQLGEGCAFLRFPSDCDLRPVVTGWFAEFGLLAADRRPGQVPYSSGDDRFAGATYDPTSHYRAAEVLEFFVEHHLSAERLREISQHQVGRLIEVFDRLDLDPGLIRRPRSVPLDRLGGFLALRSPHAQTFHDRLLSDHGVHTDSRAEVLRFGPAPYLCDRQLDDAIAALGAVARDLSGR